MNGSSIHVYTLSLYNPIDRNITNASTVILPYDITLYSKYNSLYKEVTFYLKFLTTINLNRL